MEYQVNLLVNMSMVTCIIVEKSVEFIYACFFFLFFRSKRSFLTKWIGPIPRLSLPRPSGFEDLIKLFSTPIIIIPYKCLL